MEKTVPTLIVAPPGRMRDSLRVLVNATPIPTTVYESDSLTDSQTLVASVSPGLIIFDASLPNQLESDSMQQDLWALITDIRANNQSAQCYVLVYNHQQKQQALSMGVSGVLVPGFSIDELNHVLSYALIQ